MQPHRSIRPLIESIECTVEDGEIVSILYELNPNGDGRHFWPRWIVALAALLPLAALMIACASLAVASTRTTDASIARRMDHALQREFPGRSVEAECHKLRAGGYTCKVQVSPR